VFSAESRILPLGWRVFAFTGLARAKISSPPADAFVCFFLGGFLLEFGFRSGSSFGLLCVIFLFARWRQGKRLFEFARLIFLFGFVGVAQLFVWLSQFFVSVPVAAGSVCWRACGAFVLFGFCLFEKKLLSSWCYHFYFASGLCSFLYE
jgi:hypothetical protein